METGINKLMQREDLKLSLKMGFFGLGMGGCSIAAECASIKTNVKNNKNPYTSILVNTNQLDLDKIPDSPTIRKLALKGYEKGAGRDIEIGERAFRENKEEVAELVKEYFQDREFIWVVTGLGGGTGTGSVIEAVRLLYNEGFAGRVGMILTTPRDKEGYTVIDNAVARLKTFAQAMGNLGCMLLVDNQKLYDMYLEKNKSATITEYLEYSNEFIAQTLHEINAVTASFHPFGGYHFDSSELLKMFNTAGVLSFSKVTLKESATDAEKVTSYLPEFKRSVQEGILSDGHKLSSAERAAVSLITKNSAAERIFTMDFINSIEEELERIAPIADEKPVATYSVPEPKINEVYVYAIFAGLSLPKRIADLVKKHGELAEMMEAKEEDDVLSALSSYKIEKKQKNKFAFPDSEVSATKELDSDPFSDGDSSQTSKEKKKIDPFRGLL